MKIKEGLGLARLQIKASGGKKEELKDKPKDEQKSESVKEKTDGEPLPRS